MTAKKLGGPMLLTYVGGSDTRHFSKGDSVGVELTFVRNTPLEVDGKIAKLILGDENLSAEFEGGGVTPTIDDSIDDAQEVFTGL
jgi:hypothetical protein